MFGELQNLRNYLNHLIKVNGKSTQKFYLIYLQLILEEFISSIRFLKFEMLIITKTNIRKIVSLSLENIFIKIFLTKIFI